MNKKESSAKKKQAKILLAEDDKFITRAFRDGFVRQGYNVICSVDGVDTLKKIKKHKPNVILLDLLMPIMDGFDVLKKLQDDKDLSKIPVIVLSNLGDQKDINKAKDLGAKEYLLKANFTLPEVIKIINKYL